MQTLTCGYCHEPIENPRRVDQKYHGGECSNKGRKVKTRHTARARRVAIARDAGHPAEIPSDVAVKTTSGRRISVTSPLSANDDWKRKPAHFVGVDGEGIPGSCYECTCVKFNPASGQDDEPNPLCECGHTQIGRTLFHADECYDDTCDCRKYYPTADDDSMCMCGHPEEYRRFPVGHEHVYVLLGIGQDQLSRKNGIQWWEAFQFLYSHYDPDDTYVGFFLGYDFTQIIKTIEFERARMILDPETIKDKRARNKAGDNHTPFPAEITVPPGTGVTSPSGETCVKWQVDMLPPARRFKLRPKFCECQRTECEHVKGIPWMYICDAGPFFQSSFLSVVNPYKKDGTLADEANRVVTPEEYAILMEGKSNRSSAFTLNDDMRRYNRLENKILTRVMTKLDGGFRSMGIYLNKTKWFGPGQAAQEWMLQQRANGLMPSVDSNVPKEYQDVAKKTYYGGTFEIMAHGIIPGITYEYDINSAYPWVMSTLPCLEHGTWKRGKGRSGKLTAGHLRMEYVEAIGYHPYLGPIPFRSPDGSISRPLSVEGWYWHHEIAAARRAGLIRKATVTEWVEYMPCECRPPLRGLTGLYEHRLRVGKDTWEGKSAKSVYNSVYGKNAQSAGFPKFGNPIYASLITAGCRVMYLDAIATHPDGILSAVMIATDGIYFRAPHPGIDVDRERYIQEWNDSHPGDLKKDDDRLGYWSRAEKHNLTLFKPGVYWDDNARDAIAKGEIPELKSRGVSAKYLAKIVAETDKQFEQWEPHRTPFPRIQFRCDFSMITTRQALQGSNGKSWKKAGYVSTKYLVQDSNPSSKRETLYGLAYIISPERVDQGIYRSDVQDIGEGGPRTTPYDKSFGWGDDQEEECGITTDGSVLAGFRGGLLLR